MIRSGIKQHTRKKTKVSFKKKYHKINSIFLSDKTAVPKVRDLEASGKFASRKSKKEKFSRKKKERDDSDKREVEAINNYYFV